MRDAHPISARIPAEARIGTLARPRTRTRAWTSLRAALWRRRRSPWLRWARNAALALVGVWLAYVLVANLLLRTRMLRRILSGHPEKLWVDYKSASTLWPARVRIEALVVRASDENLQWALGIEQTRVTISLWELLHRHFHATRVDARGVSFRLRQKVDPARVTAESTDRLPPIDGFADPPVRGDAPTLPEPTDRNYALWSVQLDRVDAAAVSEVWIDAYRYVGESHVWGTMVLRPLRRLEVGPATVLVESGGVWTGQDPVGVDVSGVLRATIEGHDPRDARGSKILRFLTAETQLDGTLENLHFVRHFLKDPTFRVDGGSGRVSSSIVIDHGLLAPGTAVDIVARRAALAHDELGVESDLHATFHSRGEAWRPDGLIEVSLGGVGFHDGRVERSPIEAPVVMVTATSARLDLERPFTDLRAHTDLPDVRIANLRVIDVQFPPRDAFSLEGGSARAHGSFDLSVADEHASGVLTMTSERLLARIHHSRLEARSTIQLRLDDADFAERTLDFSKTSTDLRDVSTTGAASDEAWWGHFEASRLLVHLRPARLDATVAGRAKDGRPLLALFETNMKMPGWVPLALAVLPGGPAHGEGFVASAKVSVAAGAVDVSSLEVKGGGTHVDGEIHIHGPRRRGAVLVSMPPLSVGIALHDTGTSISPMAGADWLRGHRAD